MVKKYLQNNKIQYAISKWVADDINDIKKLPKSPMGSTVFVIHENKTYMVDSTQTTWYPINNPINGDNSEPIVCDCVEELTIWGDLTE
jgi:hypothetical protein